MKDNLVRERLRARSKQTELGILREYLRERRKRTALRSVASSAVPDRPVLVERSR
jgi:hypothetical protein